MKVGNPSLQLQVRDPTCDLCRLGLQTTSEADTCITGVGMFPDAPMAVVSKFPLSTKSRAHMSKMLEQVGLDPSQVLWLSALKCRVWDVDPNKTDQKACKPYLIKELEIAKPKYVLTMGNEALFGVLGKSGITKYRSRTYDVDFDGSPAQVLPTIAPQAVERNPGQRAGFISDLSMFSALVRGVSEDTDSDRPPVVHVLDKPTLKRMVRSIKQAVGCSFDIETRSLSSSWLESDPSSVIVSLALTLWFDDEGKQTPEIYALPLAHPQSPFRNNWKQLLRMLAPHLQRIKKTIAHNGKYDLRWLRHNGVMMFETFDTMLAAYILDENRPKGLKPLAHTLLGIPAWGIDTSDLWSLDLKDVLEYNGLDTWYTYKLYRLFKAQLKENPRKANIFMRLLMPASNEFVDIERRGIWCDRERLETRWEECKKKLADIEFKINQYVPNEHPYKDVNFNASNFLRWFLFTYLDLPILGRGKQKDDGSPGAPSVAEALLKSLAEIENEGGKVCELLIERIEWNKFDTSFFTPYSQIIDENDRIHTTFKVAGTTTGRLASGKEDDTDKISAKSQLRGMNAQQVPRNNFIRGLFGAAPGYTFIEADYSQVELRIAAFIARETNLMRLYQLGEDVHMAMAMRMTGKPARLVTKEERKKAKAVNFGFLYGMGWRKFIETAWEKYGVRVTEDEARAFRTAFFAEFPLLLRWHQKQRSLAAKYKRVESPLGRVRHLPDIDSPAQGVRAEAERQAINSPVQACASDLTLLAMTRLQRKFRTQGLDAHSIGTVHDAVNFECRTDLLPMVLPMIKDEMENLPTQKLFGVTIDVPLVADLKVGQYWGDARELSEEEIYAYAV